MNVKQKIYTQIAWYSPVENANFKNFEFKAGIIIIRMA